MKGVKNRASIPDFIRPSISSETLLVSEGSTKTDEVVADNGPIIDAAKRKMSVKMSVYNQVGQPDCYSDEKSWSVLLCLLGDFRLVVAGNLIPLPAGGKKETLLTHLALQFEGRVARERLIQVLWPSNDLAHSLSSLNTLVHELHKLIGDALNGVPLVLHEDGYYRLNPRLGSGVDVRCFDLLVTSGDQRVEVGDAAGAFTVYHRAAEFYRGDLCVATDVQTTIERERLRTRYLTLLVQLANSCYQAGDYNICLEYLWKLLGRDPYREDAHRLVMQCYVRRGERAAALHHYQVCVDLLQAEFNALPEAVTTALFERIRTDPESI